MFGKSFGKDVFDAPENVVDICQALVNTNKFRGARWQVDFGRSGFQNIAGEWFEALLSGGHRQRLLAWLVGEIQIFKRS